MWSENYICFCLSHQSFKENNYTGLILLHVWTSHPKAKTHQAQHCCFSRVKRSHQSSQLFGVQCWQKQSLASPPGSPPVWDHLINAKKLLYFWHLEAEQNIQLMPQDVVIGKRLWNKGWHIMNLTILLVYKIAFSGTFEFCRRELESEKFLFFFFPEQADLLYKRNCFIVIDSSCSFWVKRDWSILWYWKKGASSAINPLFSSIPQ